MSLRIRCDKLVALLYGRPARACKDWVRGDGNVCTLELGSGYSLMWQRYGDFEMEGLNWLQASL